jgi:hypothetical protein
MLMDNAMTESNITHLSTKKMERGKRKIILSHHHWQLLTIQSLLLMKIALL